jgi:hypothetical protein
MIREIIGVAMTCGGTLACQSLRLIGIGVPFVFYC